MWFKRRDVVIGHPDKGLTGFDASLRLGDIARDSGDAGTAALHYAAAVALGTERNDVKVQLGNALKDVGRLSEADVVYEEAQAADPDNPDIWIQRGRIRKLRGDRAGALAFFRHAAGLDPDSADAAHELISVGAPGPQHQRFEVHFRAGGSEAIMHMSHQIAAMRAVLDDMAERLPDALGQTAFPVEDYAIYRELYGVPPPPPGPRVAVTAILLFDRETIPTLDAQLSALKGQTLQTWTVLAVGQEPERRAVVDRAAITDPRIRVVAAEATEAEAVSEWRAAGTVTDGWIVLLAPGAFLEREALAWASAVPALAPADAYVTDEDQGRLEAGRITHAGPVFRSVVDYDTLLEANVYGETLIIAAEAYHRLCPTAPDGTVARARSRLLLDLARGGLVGHLPQTLVNRLAFVRPSLPEHRLAIADHAAAQRFSDRIAVAKGETGPTHWRARSPDVPIAVVISTRDDPHQLRRLIGSLRELATAPDHVRLVILDGGSTQPDTRAILDELREKRYVTMLSDAMPSNRSRGNNLGARAVDAPLLVFASDDVTMLTEAWDERLRGHLERDDVGAVGTRMLYADDTIHHAGILFGWKGSTINDGLYEPADAPGPARRLQVTRAVSAVTGAFLATRRDRFLEIGGFDDVGLPGAFGDIDYCLKLRSAGLRILYTPAVTLRDHERKPDAMSHLMPETAGRQAAEQAVMDARWGRILADDPGLNPIWYPATMPFRLLSAPSSASVVRHIATTSSRTPWAVPKPAAITPDGIAATP